MKSMYETVTKKLKPDWILLVIRLVLGVIFVQSGLGKLMDFGQTVQFFASLGIPAPAINAGVASTMELTGGIALIAGLGVRILSIPLIFIMIVAILTVQLSAIAGIEDLIRLQEFDYILMFLVLIIMGAGKYSLDYFLKRL